MRGAIMQPYFFPYIGYYQLAYGVEKFIFLDDVNYIKKGYVNRNSILFNKEKFYFSIPVEKISQNRKINEHNYTGDFLKFLNLIENAYKKSPNFHTIMPLIEDIALDQNLNVAEKNSKSLIDVFSYLDIDRDFLFSSKIDPLPKEKGEERILTLCKKSNINKYINAFGGQSLYDIQNFKNSKIELKFIKSNIPAYSQGCDNFIENLSIIDILMNCDKKETRELLEQYSLI